MKEGKEVGFQSRLPKSGSHSALQNCQQALPSLYWLPYKREQHHLGLIELGLREFGPELQEKKRHWSLLKQRRRVDEERDNHHHGVFIYDIGVYASPQLVSMGWLDPTAHVVLSWARFSWSIIKWAQPGLAHIISAHVGQGQARSGQPILMALGFHTAQRGVLLLSKTTCIQFLKS